jgi:hypothetical protein
MEQEKKKRKELPLALFMLFGLANNTNFPFAQDNVTVFTDFFNRRTDFHRKKRDYLSR